MIKSSWKPKLLERAFTGEGVIRRNPNRRVSRDSHSTVKKVISLKHYSLDVTFHEQRPLYQNFKKTKLLLHNIKNAVNQKQADT